MDAPENKTRTKRERVNGAKQLDVIEFYELNFKSIKRKKSLRNEQHQFEQIMGTRWQK